VTGFVGAGSYPLPLSDKEIRDILIRVGKDQSKVKVEINLNLGDTVKVKSGPFAGQVGPVIGVFPEKGKVKFTVNFLGRETETEVDYFLLEKI
jgi:transcriptional antiterminator NusG